MSGQLRRHFDDSRVTLAKTADGQIRVLNEELPSGEFVWDFHLSPGEARKFADGLIRYADEIEADS